MTDNRMKSIYQKRTRIGDNILKVLIYLAAGVAIALLVGIMGYVFVRGLPQVSWQLLSTVQSSLKGTFGILGNIINTIYIIVITLIIAAPIGIGSAIYLNEYAKPGKLVRTIEFTTEILSGIPSIIFGLFGMVFFGMTLKLGYSVLTGSFTLTLMVLPLITRNTQEALKTVPDSYRSGALGIGATKWYMIRTILLPSAALDPISTLKIEDLMGELKKNYTVVIVTHNMQQATRIADYTAFFLVGEVVEYAPTTDLFSHPREKKTEDYITGRFG